ncbi:MAG: hypothetical protein ACOYMN_25625, partial [Roseimicrobium sp.]
MSIELEADTLAPVKPLTGWRWWLGWLEGSVVVLAAGAINSAASAHELQKFVSSGVNGSMQIVTPQSPSAGIADWKT